MHMKTILVPVDFSETSRNSAAYAIDLAKWAGMECVMLFNAYSVPLATEMSWALLQTEELQKASEQGLQVMKDALMPAAGDVRIELKSAFGFLTERIGALCEELQPDLIVMGITGGSKLDEVLIGSNTTHLAHHIRVPLLIIPPNSVWKPVAKLGWACDYKDSLNTTPEAGIRKMIQLLKARLVIVHNDPHPEAFDPELLKNNDTVYNLFHDLDPEYVMVADTDFSHAMNEFVDQYRVEMLMIVPKKHGWLSSLFHRSHTKQLAFHSHVPVLCVQATD